MNVAEAHADLRAEINDLVALHFSAATDLLGGCARVAADFEQVRLLPPGLSDSITPGSLNQRVALGPGVLLDVRENAEGSDPSAPLETCAV